MWSPISRVGIIEPDGIWKASTTKARSSSATATATPIDSAVLAGGRLAGEARWSSIASSSGRDGLALRSRSCSPATPRRRRPRPSTSAEAGRRNPVALLLEDAPGLATEMPPLEPRTPRRRAPRHHPCLPIGLAWSIHLEDGQEGLLRNLHVADLLHPLLTFFWRSSNLRLRRCRRRNIWRSHSCGALSRSSRAMILEPFAAASPPEPLLVRWPRLDLPQQEVGKLIARVRPEGEVGSSEVVPARGKRLDQRIGTNGRTNS